MSILLANIFVNFFVFFCSATLEESLDNLPGFEALRLNSVVGPESLVFDTFGGGPYTGVSDGRIFKWQGHPLGWAEFAVPPQRRRKLCDGSQNVLHESICGRTLGLQFHKATGYLYMADAFNGLLAVGPKGGVAVPLATRANGQPFHFLNGLDIDQQEGLIYFTDSSSQYRRSDYLLIVASGDATGRLLKYDPRSKNVTVLLKSVVYPNGVALSKDNSFILVSQTSICRILRYWLRGPRAGTTDVFADRLPGYPDNIKRNSVGEFWVALTQKYKQVAVKLSMDGRILEVLDGTIAISISEVGESNGTLWMGSVSMPYVGVYRRQNY